MRYGKWLAALVLALGLTASAKAQVSPGSLQFVPLSTSNSVVPIAQPQMFNHTFSLANFLPNISSMFSSSPIIGQSQYPMTYQPDVSYFAPFGMRRLTPINVPY